MNVIWIQSSRNRAEDYYFRDGVLQTSEGNKYDAEIFLSEVQYFARFSSYRFRIQRKLLASPNFELKYIPFFGFIYQSIFNENLAEGRPAVFLANFEKASARELWSQLSAVSVPMGLTLREEEKQYVETYVSRILSSWVRRISIINFWIVCIILYKRIKRFLCR